MIHRVLTVPLKPDGSGFTLSRIGNQNRLNELEFYFPLKLITPKMLKGIFAGYKEPVSFENFPERIGQLRFMPVRGFMRGFIDMVFHFEGCYYLVHWKSNYLGDSVEDYGQDALITAMDEHYYVFQYYIYTVALHQYLTAIIMKSTLAVYSTYSCAVWTRPKARNMAFTETDHRRS
jgi:exodeoxyribonuclease V beta subunit